MSLVKNSTIVLTGVMISNGLAYSFHFIAGRTLGPDEYGVFGSLMALFMLAALPATALSSAITKYTARFHHEEDLGRIAVFRKTMQTHVFIFSSVLLALAVVFSRMIADYLNIDSVIPVIIVGVSLVFSMLLPVNRGILQGMKKFQVFSVNSIIEAGARMLFLVVFLKVGLGVNGAILSYGLAFFVAFLSVFPYIKETKAARTVEDEIDIKPVYRFVMQVLMVTIVMQSILNVPSLVIKHYYSNEFTGDWTAALNLARLSLFVTAAISMVMFPEIARERDVHVKRKIFYKASLLVFVATAGMALVFFLFPKLMIMGLYGKAYLGAVPILQGMGIAMVGFGMLQLRLDYFLAKLE